MKAVVLHEHGGPEVLKMEEIPEPACASGEARVAIHACALNRLDLWVRKGLPNLRHEYPHRLGSDIAGVVEEGPATWVGREVVINPGLSCGQCQRCLSGQDNLCRHYRILGENTQGGYAESITVPVQNLLPKPKRLSMVEAAAFPLTFLTAWQMVVAKGQVSPGDVVLVHAAGSGVSVAAMQIAQLHGARCIALASSDAKLERAKQLGAIATVRSDYKDWHRLLRGLPEMPKAGFDLVIEHVGAATWERSLKLARWGGKIVTCGASSGWDAHTDLRQVFFRQLEILGSTMGSKAHLHQLLPHIDSGALQVVVDRVFALEEAAEAHRYLDRREQFGKVVLKIR